VERLAKMVRRQREAGNQWSHRVLSSRPPLIIPKAEVLTKGTLNAALDTLDGDINDYEETFDQPIEPKNGYHH